MSKPLIIVAYFLGCGRSLTVVEFDCDARASAGAVSKYVLTPSSYANDPDAFSKGGGKCCTDSAADELTVDQNRLINHVNGFSCIITRGRCPHFRLHLCT